MLLREKAILKMIGSLVTACVLVMTAMCMSGTAIYANVLDESVKAEPYYIDTVNGRIFVESAESECFLLLSNEVDVSHIALKAVDGSTVSLVKDGTEYEELDLTDEIGSGGSCDVEAIIKNESGSKTGGFSLRIMKGTGIGTVYYFSDDPDKKGRAWIEKDKENRTSGRALVFDGSGKNLTEDEKSQVIKDFHGRGHASWRYPKKGYQLKFDKKISLVENTGKEKKWVLLALYADPLRMGDLICKRMAEVTRSDYSPKGTWVNFYYDGEYRGVYELSEKNEVKSGRLDINDLEKEYEEQDPDYGDHLDLKTARNSYGGEYRYQRGLVGPEEPGGFLIEMNDSFYDENNGFTYNVGNIKRGINIKSPELGSKEFVKYVSEYFQEFVDAVYAVDENGEYTGKNPNTGKYYYEYCDIDSLVDTYLIQLIPSNWDAFSRSLYFYKDRGGIMMAGPVWDMDLTFGTWGKKEALPTEDKVADAVIASCLIRNHEFRKRISKRYFDTYSRVLESLISSGEDLPSFRETFSSIENDLAMDSSIWRVKAMAGSTYPRWSDDTPLGKIVDYRVNWIKNRKKYLDKYFRTMAGDEEEAHEYGDPSPATTRTHTRTCVNHPDAVITEDCTFEYASSGDGTHTRTCTQCGNTGTETCKFAYKDNGDGTHTGTCTECGYTDTSDHVWNDGKVTKKATTSKPGSRKFTCEHCGAVKREEIPPVKTADITINTSTVKAASVKKIISKVQAAGGTTDTIILGKKVKKISASSFKGTGIKTVTLKTSKLTEVSVKGSLKSSKVKSIKVRIGSSKTNKKYVKSYKKIFTKKNAGRAVKVS